MASDISPMPDLLFCCYSSSVCTSIVSLALGGFTRQKRYAIVFDLATRSISKIAFFRRAFSSTTAMRILMFDRESGELTPTA